MPVGQLIAEGLIEADLQFRRAAPTQQYARRPRRRKRRQRWPLALARGNTSGWQF